MLSSEPGGPAQGGPAQQQRPELNPQPSTAAKQLLHPLSHSCMLSLMSSTFSQSEVLSRPTDLGSLDPLSCSTFLEHQPPPEYYSKPLVPYRVENGPKETENECNGKMNLTCITSEDPAALTVTKLYDENDDFGHFWIRDDPTIPLRPCSNVSYSSQCSVCWDQLVKVVCRNLTDGVKIFMEGPEGSITFNQTGCAEPPSPLLAYPRTHLPAIISVIICVILIFIVGVLWKCCQKVSVSD
ncbi:hypothetical protein CRENBAI_015524 [Crenichthys baileyi]|uniref:Uncharacterized protein n=1 Tax=Crenichthys baileyi TaxID=28760 RepID=A0AAV9SDG6_9TELE